MVKFGDDFLQRVSQCDEVKDVRVAVEGACQFNGRSPVVSVQSLANVPIERDEVGGAKDQVVFRDSHFPGFVWHQANFLRGNFGWRLVRDD